MRFTLLYSFVLGSLLGGIELLKTGLPEELEVVEEQVISELVAIPPKPEGARLPEGEGDGAAYSEEACNKHQGDYREACFHTLALQRAERDPEGALAACDAIETTAARWECVSDVAELHSVVDRSWSEATCTTIKPRKWHDQCYFGIALAWSTTDFTYARGKCEESGRWRNFCRHDVNGEIAQVDPAEAFRWCTEAEHSPFQREMCFHGLGKYLGRSDPEAALGWCARIPAKESTLRQQCAHGMGWAVAESSVDQALSFCDGRVGEYADSCFLGVSANTKRFDVGRALEICGRVRGSELRGRCEDFLREG